MTKNRTKAAEEHAYIATLEQHNTTLSDENTRLRQVVKDLSDENDRYRRICAQNGWGVFASLAAGFLEQWIKPDDPISPNKIAR